MTAALDALTIRAASVRLENVTKKFGTTYAVTETSLADRSCQAGDLARTERLRQDHHAAHDRRTRSNLGWTHFD